MPVRARSRILHVHVSNSSVSVAAIVARHQCRYGLHTLSGDRKLSEALIRFVR